jgi:acyl carrier protein
MRVVDSLSVDTSARNESEAAGADDELATIQRELLALWREMLRNDALTLDDDPLQLGATSMQIMSVIGRLAEEMSIEVPVEAMFDAITIGEQASTLRMGL